MTDLSQKFSDKCFLSADEFIAEIEAIRDDLLIPVRSLDEHAEIDSSLCGGNDVV